MCTRAATRIEGKRVNGDKYCIIYDIVAQCTASVYLTPRFRNEKMLNC